LVWIGTRRLFTGNAGYRQSRGLRRAVADAVSEIAELIFHYVVRVPLRSPRAHSYYVKRDLTSVQIKISFDFFIVESRSTKRSQPEPGCDQAESLAKMTGR